MTALLIFLAGFYALAAYVCLEQAWQAAETGEDDFLTLAPTIARWRGIDFEERRADRLHLEAVAFAHLVEAVQTTRRVFDQEREATLPLFATPYGPRLDPLADGPLDPEEFATADKVTRLRRDRALDRIAADIGAGVTSTCRHGCRRPATAGSECDECRYLRNTWGA